MTGCASEAYERGRAEAERDIVAGEPHLIHLGLPPTEASALDPSTGLLRWSARCVVNDEALGFMDGYNDQTMAALGSGRLEPLTLGHKHTTWELVAARFREEEVERSALADRLAICDFPRFR